MSSLEVGMLVVTVIGFIPLYADWVRRWRKRHEVNFKFLRFFNHLGDDWLLRIYKPDKPIVRCSVTCDGVKLPWTDKGQDHYEKFIDAMGGGNVEISKGTEKRDSKVVVRDGEKIIQKKLFKDIPIVDEIKLTPDELNALGISSSG